MIIKLSNLFIWWNGQTIGTLIYTKLFGVFVGNDEHGNNYFTTKDGKKRWVNYKGDCDSSLISPFWHSWLHKTTNKIPYSNQEVKNNNDEILKIKQQNLKKPYNPKSSYNSSLYNDYTAWKP